MTNPPWVLAPREPTEEMVAVTGREGHWAFDGSLSGNPADWVIGCYRAMIAAAPAPPIAPEALDRLAAYERRLSTTHGAIVGALHHEYPNEPSYADAVAALAADLRALLKAVGR